MLRNTVIIGSGPAGLTAAIYLARSGMSPIVIAGERPGGQLCNTDVIENFPGFEAINGAELMMRVLTQAEKLGTELIYETVQRVVKNGGSFEISLSSGETLQSRTVLASTGARHKHLGVPGEKEFTNKGVSWCATCDGALYRGKNVAVVGGGNTAVAEALFLSHIAEKVYLIHRRDTLRAEEVMQKKLFDTGNVDCVWNEEIAEILGNDRVDSVKLKNSGKALSVSAIFIAVGTSPSSEIFNGILKLDPEGYIVATETETSVPGIFSAGDVVSGSVKQAVYAAGQGCLASQRIEKYLGRR
ncbi:MAG: thioredoxin-disulfide reductase [Alphaproteobacteria bacterium]|nr:thioredoxin-disulfide reductase [Alphaproteobacteria bacterium]